VSIVLRSTTTSEREVVACSDGFGKKHEDYGFAEGFFRAAIHIPNRPLHRI